VTALASGAAAIVRRDLQVFLSYRARPLTQVLTAFFGLTLFYYLSRLVRVGAFDSPDAYYGFAVAGLIALQLVNALLATPPAAARQELVAGTFERMVVSPLGPVAGLAASLAFPFLFALAVSLAMLAFAAVAFGLDVHWHTLPLAAPLALLAGLSFAPFALVVLALVVVMKQALAGATFAVAGIALIAGLYFPVELLPAWAEWAAHAQPFTPAVELLRWSVTGAAEPGWDDLAKVVAFAAALLPAALLLLSAAIRRARRRGTIVEW
jgi:ABC-2 type transport system permease protein